jgi:lactate racemase
LPHPMAGFGGGPKIILPGIVSWHTIYYNHMDLNQKVRDEGKGADIHFGSKANDLWQDICETADLAGLQLKVDALLNGHRQVAGLIAGHHRAIREQGVKMGKEFYATEPVADADVVISNNFGKSNEATLGTWSPNWTTTRNKDLVTIATCPQGQVVHYLYGSFGESALGCGNPKREVGVVPPGIRRFLYYTPYPEKSAERWFNTQGTDSMVSTWDEVLARLEEWHPNGARVAVYPDLTVQYLDVDK